MSENLKPCPNPWCASTSAPLPANGKSGWRIVCACGVRTFSCQSYDDAITAWNTRAPQAGEPKPVAWRVDWAATRHTLYSDKVLAERDAEIFGCVAKPLFAHPPKADPDMVRLVEAMAWFDKNRGLSLEFDWSDADTDGLDWCVYRERGGINDREWDLVANAPTPQAAILAAFSALGEG